MSPNFFSYTTFDNNSVPTRNVSNDLHDLNSKIDKIVIFLDLNAKEVSK